MDDELNFCVEISENGLEICVNILNETACFYNLDPERAKECIENCEHLFEMMDSYDAENDDKQFLDDFLDAVVLCLEECFPEGPKPIHKPEWHKRKEPNHSPGQRM